MEKKSWKIRLTLNIYFKRCSKDKIVDDDSGPKTKIIKGRTIVYVLFKIFSASQY